MARQVAPRLELRFIVFVLASSVRVPLPALAISNGSSRAGRHRENARPRAGPTGFDERAASREGRNGRSRARCTQWRSDEVRTRLSAEIPLRRYGEPESLPARLPTFPAASYTTGACFPSMAVRSARFESLWRLVAKRLTFSRVQDWASAA